MSAAAGAPPPPPPPPPTRPPPPTPPFGGLPTELLLNIIELLSRDDYINFAMAIYPILRSYGLVPVLTSEIYQSLTQQAPNMNSQRRDQRENSQGSLRLPIELNDEIMDYLKPEDRVAWIFSHRELFRSYFEGLSEETRKSLSESVCKEPRGWKDKDGDQA
ncbi:hypothetical protein P171DRAFT_45397 [Karstenula rhodostoma CBS 690.94]|uniref:F-box domain-containing protein n=1 Tax=Karstenula rhodostoma CBS 690.94 TaxID=1392251 RepID=A0A9P4UB39_9PLEO|nr:hypothetical protein P171DRAFT_45397 [Karstenula rhodostoma CBS 690.94]